MSRTQADEARWPLVAAGALLGLLALNRPNALVYGAAVPALVAFASWPRGARAALGRAALVLLPLVVVTGWERGAQRRGVRRGDPSFPRMEA